MLGVKVPALDNYDIGLISNFYDKYESTQQEYEMLDAVIKGRDERSSKVLEGDVRFKKFKISRSERSSYLVELQALAKAYLSPPASGTAQEVRKAFEKAAQELRSAFERDLPPVPWPDFGPMPKVTKILPFERSHSTLNPTYVINPIMIEVSRGDIIKEIRWTGWEGTKENKFLVKFENKSTVVPFSMEWPREELRPCYILIDLIDIFGRRSVLPFWDSVRKYLYQDALK